MPEQRSHHDRSPGAAHATGGGAGRVDAGDAPRAAVERVLALIRPAVKEDGGDVELVAVHPDGLVQVRFHGACVGCPSAGMTLHHGIERTLRAHLGTQIRVEAVS